MRRLAVLLISAGMLAVPVTAIAHPAKPGAHPAKPGARAVGNHVPRKLARQACIAERTQVGKVAFKAKYGASKAVSSCVKSKLPATREATKTCRSERRQVGAKAFRAKYPGKNAVRVCVRDATGG